MTKIKFWPLITFAFLLTAACGSPLNPYNSGSSSQPATSPNLCMNSDKAQEMLYSTQAMDISENKLSGSAFIVRLKDPVSGKEKLLQDLKSSAKDPSLIAIDAINDTLVRVQASPGSKTYQVLSAYIDSNEIQFIEPDYPIHGTLLLNDPSITKQWAHEVIQSAKAWDLSEGANVVVGVIDSGLDINHPDIKDNVFRNTKEVINGIDDDGNGFVDDVNGWNFVSDSNQVLSDDSSYHGTHVSGTIGAVGNNGVGVTGHAPKVKILPLKYLNSAGAGVTSNAIRAIDYAIKMKVRILSNSWGSFTPSSALQNAIRRAAQAGILFVAAAGNGDSAGRGVNLDQTGFYPSAYPEDNILSVAASDINDNIPGWSNFGATTVDIAAPGVGIYSLRNVSAGSYATLSGTSMATPLVSGVAALILSERPDLSYRDVKKIILASVDKIGSIKSKVISGGRINAYKAVSMAKTYPGTTGDVGNNPDITPAFCP